MRGTETTGGHPSPRRAWAIVALCTLAYVLSFVDRQMLSLLIEPVKADLAISDTQFGLLNGLAFSIFYATMGLPLAGIADRRSRPAIIACGIAFWSISTIACGAARSFPQLFLARIGVGAGEAALSPAAYSLIADIFPRDRLGRALGVYSLGSFVGAGLAFLVGGAVIAIVGRAGDTMLAGMALRPWQFAFVAIGAPGLILAAIVALTVSEPRASDRSAARDIPGFGPSFGAVLRFLRDERAIFIPHMAGFTCAAMALFAILGWSPAYLIRTFGLTAGESGVWLGCIALLGGGGGVLASGWLVDALTRRGRRDAPFCIGMVGTAGTLAAGAALPLAGTAPAAAGVIAVALFFASFAMPTSTAVMQIVAPPRMRSRVSALFLCANSLIGLAAGSFLVGLLNDHLFRTAAGVGASMALVTTVAALFATVLLTRGRGALDRWRGAE